MSFQLSWGGFHPASVLETQFPPLSTPRFGGGPLRVPHLGNCRPQSLQAWWGWPLLLLGPLRGLAAPHVPQVPGPRCSIVYSPPSWPRRPTCLWPAWGRRPDDPLHPWRWAKSCGRWVLARASGPGVRVTAGRQQVEWPRAHPGSVGVAAPGEVPLEAGPRGRCCGPRRLARGSGRGLD